MRFRVKPGTTGGGRPFDKLRVTKGKVDPSTSSGGQRGMPGSACGEMNKPGMTDSEEYQLKDYM